MKDPASILDREDTKIKNKHSHDKVQSNDDVEIEVVLSLTISNSFIIDNEYFIIRL